MKRITSYLVLSLAFLAVAGLCAAPAFAHETRIFGNGSYILVVGFHNEPTFEDEGNGIDMFVLYDTKRDGKCLGQDCIPVDISQGDTVDLSVRVMYLQNDTFNSPVLASEKLQGELIQAYLDPSRYTIFFKPNLEGAYGFKISGTIRKADKPQPAVVLNQEKFVCGRGTQGDEAFDCVTTIMQPFPLPAASSYRDDSPHSH